MENDRFKSHIGRALEQESTFAYHNWAADVVEQNICGVDISKVSSKENLSVVSLEYAASITGNGKELFL